jgi:hypothetical protein
MIMVHEPFSDLNRHKEGIMTKFLVYCSWKKIQTPKKVWQGIPWNLVPDTFWFTGKAVDKTELVTVPEFMELCRNCRYHREVELREKEKVRFNEFVRKVKDE